ncbi:MAG: hypothetical protein LBQ66_02200, partial [Planctomycetaceae bacterium]|nr:hypothetical protein [Planctomycetaceae bacterium]
LLPTKLSVLCVCDRKVGNRPPGGYVGVLADNRSGKRIGKTKTPYVLGVLVLPMRVLPHCFRRAPLAETAIHQVSPAVGCPPYDHKRINRTFSSVASYRR